MNTIYPENISRAEMLYSATAQRLSIDNSIPNDDIEHCVLRAAWALQTLRDKLLLVTGEELPIDITSGYRCEELNVEIGGSDKSAHRGGNAIDFTVRDWTVKETIDFIVNYMPELIFDQLINEYDQWVHLALVRYNGEQRMQVF
jgi:zinc D-Ala-D-Ala carboxypeptidase